MIQKGIKKQNKNTVWTRIVAMHPHKTFLIVAILGIAILFLFMLLAFQLTKPPTFGVTNFKFPKAFILSTVVILLSSFVLGNLMTLYKRDQILAIRNKLLIAFGLGIVFCVLQFSGWRELSQSGVKFQGLVSGSYLYLISGLHLAHLVGGMIILYIELIMVWQKSKDSVKCLIYFTDPYQMLKLELLRLYWHFMDALWLVLFFYFLFSL